MGESTSPEDQAAQSPHSYAPPPQLQPQLQPRSQPHQRQPQPQRRRACDSCRIRKVKCDHARPQCSQCVHFNLPCVVSPPVNQRKNPVRGRLVAQARGDKDLSHWDTGLPPQSLASDASSPRSDHAGLRKAESTASRDEFSEDFFLELVPWYEQLVYPVNPVITPNEISDAIAAMQNNAEDAALVYAFASATMFLVQKTNSKEESVEVVTDRLMQLSLEARKQLEPQISPDGRIAGGIQITIKKIMTCIFLEVSMMGFKRLDRSFTLLREAITMLQMLEVRGPPADGPQLARYQRTYGEAYIHERFLTMHSGYPSILPPPKAGFPQVDPTIPSNIDFGFRCLISLFKTLDDDFLAFWRGQQTLDTTGPKPTADWVERKQTQLDEGEAQFLQEEAELIKKQTAILTELQRADHHVTRIWIRTLLWQLALSYGLLQLSPPETAHIGLSLQYPVQRVSGQLRDLIYQLESVASIILHGSGIVQKLFEITTTIADVLTLSFEQARQNDQGLLTQVGDVIFLIKFVLQLERITDGQKAYLYEKIDKLVEIYPGVNVY